MATTTDDASSKATEKAPAEVGSAPQRRAVLAVDPGAERDRDDRPRAPAPAQVDSEDEQDGEDEEQGDGEEDDLLADLPDETDVRLVLRVSCDLTHSRCSPGNRACPLSAAEPGQPPSNTLRITSEEIMSSTKPDILPRS